MGAYEDYLAELAGAPSPYPTAPSPPPYPTTTEPTYYPEPGADPGLYGSYIEPAMNAVGEVVGYPYRKLSEFGHELGLEQAGPEPNLAPDLLKTAGEGIANYLYPDIPTPTYIDPEQFPVLSRVKAVADPIAAAGVQAVTDPSMLAFMGAGAAAGMGGTIGKVAGAVERGVGAAIVPGMASSAIESGKHAYEAAGEQGALSPEALGAGAEALSSGAFAALGGAHAVGAKLPAWVGGAEKPAETATEPTPTGEPETVTRYATAKKPQAPPNEMGFYSQLERVADQMPQAMKAGDALRYFSDPKRGVKAEEMKATGLDDFLQERAAAGQGVTPQEVQEFVRTNKAELREVVRGGPEPEAEDSVRAAGLKALYSMGNLGYNRPEQALAELRERTRRIGVDAAMEHAQIYDEYKPAVRALLDATPERLPTKFAQWQTPGGKNYREFELILPYEKEGVGELRPGETLVDALDRRQAENPVFRGGHFPEPNVVAHMRANERFIPDENGPSTDEGGARGYRTAHIEEVQSDWAQRGREEGFRQEDTGEGKQAAALARQQMASIAAEMQRIDPDFAPHQNDPDLAVRAENSVRYGQGRYDEAQRQRLVELAAEFRVAQQKERTFRNAQAKGQPTGPYVTDTSKWSELAMKRMVKWAADNGFDRLTWTTGEQQAARYDLSKQVDSVLARNQTDGTFVLSYKPKGDNNYTIIPGAMSGKELAGHIGKDLADRIVADAGKVKPGEPLEYSGIDLKVGGTGMSAFYGDKGGFAHDAQGNVVLDEKGNPRRSFLHIAADKIAKKFGARVGETEIETARKPTLAEWAETNAAGLQGRTPAEVRGIYEGLGEHLKGKTTTAHSLDLSHQMRETVSREGFSQFAAEKQGKPAEGGLTYEHVAKALPGLDIVDRGDGSYTAHLKDGLTLTVNSVGEMELGEPGSPEAAAEAASAKAGGIEDPKLVGQYRRVGQDSIIRIAKGAGADVADHEGFHFFFDVALNPKEKEAVLKHYGDEESAAYAYAKWNPATHTNSWFSKILAYAKRIYHAFKPTWESSFETVRSGRAGERVAEPDVIPDVAAGPQGGKIAYATAPDDKGGLSGVPENLVDEVEARGNRLVFRLVRNKEEADAIWAGVKAGNPGEGFRPASVVDGQQLSTKGPRIERAMKRGAVPVFTSPYPTVSSYYKGGAGWFIAIEYEPSGLIHESTRVSQTQGVAHSATFPDSEHVIDARSVKSVHVLSAEQVANVENAAGVLEGLVRRGAFRGAYRDSDPELATVNRERARRLQPPVEKLSRPFIETPVKTESGLEFMKGTKVRLQDGTVAKIKGYRPTPKDHPNPPPGGAYVEITTGGKKYLSPQRAVDAEYYAKQAEAAGDTERATRIRETQANYTQWGDELNVPVGDITAVWDKATRKWIEPAAPAEGITRYATEAQPPGEQDRARDFVEGLRPKIPRTAPEGSPEAFARGGPGIEGKPGGREGVPRETAPDIGLNIEKMGIDDTEFKGRLSEVMKEANSELSRAEIEHWADIDPAKDRILSTMGPEEVAVRVNRSGQPPTQAQLKAMRYGAKSFWQDTDAKYKAWKAEPENRAKEAAYVKANLHATAFEMFVTDQKSAAARLLASLREVLGDAKSAGEFDIERLTRVLRRKGVSSKDAADLTRIYRERPYDFAPALRKAFEPNWRDKLMYAFRAHLLSGAPTTWANGLGNAGSIAANVAETATAGLAESAEGLKRRVRGQEAVPLSERQRFFSDAKAQRRAMYSEFPTALKELLRDLGDITPGFKPKGGAKEAAGLSRWDIREPPTSMDQILEHKAGPVGDYAATKLYWKAAGRAYQKLEVWDNFFGKLISAGEWAKVANREARRKGHQGKAATEYAQQWLQDEKRKAVWAEHVGSEVKRQLFKLDLTADRGRIVALGGWAQDLTRRIPETQLIAPFVRTPTNILDMTLRFTPKGALEVGMRDWRKNEKAIRELNAQKDTLPADEYAESRQKLLNNRGEMLDRAGASLVGSLVMIPTFYAMAQSGLLTSGGPKDQREKQLKLATGWRPYSLHIGDTYLPLNRLEPIGTLLGYTADLAEMAENKKDGGFSYDNLLGMFVENAKDKPFLTGLSNLFEFMQSPSKTAEKVTVRTLGNIVPAGVAKIAQAYDPVIRDTSDDHVLSEIMNALQARTPVASTGLPARLTATGKEAQRGGEGALGAASRLASPVQYATEEEGTDVEREMLRVGYNPSLPRKDIRLPGGTRLRLSAKDYRTLLGSYDEAAKEVGRLITTAGYQSAPDTVEEGGSRSKEGMIKRIYDKYREEARMQMYADLRKRRALPSQTYGASL